MEKSWTPQELQELLPRVLARWPGSAALLRSRGAMERLRQVTRVDTSTFEALPSEIIMMFAEQLAPTDIQPYLDEAPMRTYKEAQNSLRNFGLVSRRMNDLVRPYLYRGIIIDNTDRIVQLVRTLAKHREGFGKHIKDLVLQVPFHVQDEKFKAPDVSIFLSSEDDDLVALAKLPNPNGCGRPELGRLYFHVVKWTMNLETLAFGMAMPLARQHSAHIVYLRFWVDFCRAARSPSYYRLSAFLPKLTTVHLHGGKSSSHSPTDSDQCRRLFDIPSVQKLVCYRDEGMWYDLRPTSEHLMPVYFRARGATTFQFRNITRIELRESACTPLHILDICATFPCLQVLSVSTSSRLAVRKPGDPHTVSDGMYLSDGLAKLPDLKILELDLHYNRNFSQLLGRQGVLNLQPLSGLQTLRVPLHFLVEKQADGGYVVAHSTAVLPPSLRRLTLSADMKCLTYWRASVSNAPVPSLVGQQSSGDSASTQYRTKIVLLQFLESVSGCISDYFTNLEAVTFCQGVETQVTSTAGVSSVGAVPRPHQENIRVQSPQIEADDSTIRLCNVYKALDQSGVRVAAVQERVTHGL